MLVSVCRLVRPPNIAVGGLRFYHDSIYLLSYSSSFHQLPTKLAEWNSSETGCIIGSECDLKTHVRNLWYTLLLKIGGPRTTLFTDLPT